MRKKLLILSLLLASGCSFFRENYRTVIYNAKNGDKLTLTVFEKTEMFGSEKTLNVYANNHSFRGKQCADVELKNLADELWNEITARDYASESKSGIVRVLRNHGETKPDYCDYRFTQNEHGAWESV